MSTSKLRAVRARLSFGTVLATLLAAAALTACGGGSDSSSAVITDPGAGAGAGGNTGSGSGTGGTGTTGGATASGCPSAQLEDVWVNARLGCLSVGQSFIDLASSARGTPVDRAFVVDQLVLDASWNNVLPGGKHRHFAYFLCVKGIPDQVNTLLLATDLLTAMSLMSQRPASVAATTLDIAGGDRMGWVTRACDPTTDPVIVDYATRRIVGIYPQALSRLAVYDF